MPDRPYALVTGAAGGIGLEVSRRLIARGYHVLVVERSDEIAAGAAEQLGPHATAVGCDLSDRAAVKALGERISSEWADHFEILVCNAGIIFPANVGELPFEKDQIQIDVMLVNALQLISAAVPVLKARRRGHIVATVSMGGIIAMPGSAIYSAAKSGLRAYLTALYGELKGTGVSVSGVYPSAVDTPMLREEATHGGSLLNFVGKVSTVDDVADAYDTAFTKKRLEVYVPYSDSISSRLANVFPWILSPLLPTLERFGRGTRDKYIAERGLEIQPGRH